jgi:hypothetical protein
MDHVEVSSELEEILSQQLGSSTTSGHKKLNYSS